MPFFIPIAIAATATAAGVGAYSSIQQGKEQEKQAKAAAKQAQDQAEMEARRIEQTGQFEQEQMLKERELVLGKIRRSYGKSGLMTAGTPLLDELETTKNLTMDRLVAQYNTGEQAKSVRYQGAAAANIYKQQGKAAKKAGMWGAGQSIMGGIGAVGSMYSGAQAANATKFGGTGNPITKNVGMSYGRNFKY